MPVFNVQKLASSRAKGGARSSHPRWPEQVIDCDLGMPLTCQRGCSLHMTGQVIGHYRVIEKIGAGAMGEVFRARDERLGRDVAVKLIRASSSANPDHLRRFEQEARAAAALNHPNIVSVYDVGTHDGTPYIVCELLHGRTLRAIVSAGPLPVRLAADYAQQISKGLTAAHDLHIVHRDLKPENLFVTIDGRLKILDFGVAKLQPSADSGRSVEELTTVTRSGTLVGTVGYMSPEQLRVQPVDYRSDIFSLGAVLYEMLTGQRAFRGETEVDTMTAVLKENPPELYLEERKVPLAFQQIVQHCLEKEPDQRFQSARDLAFALESLSDISGLRSAPHRPSRWLSRVFPWALAGLCLIAVVLLVATRQTLPLPSYRRLTFEQGTVYSARFAPDRQSIVYGAAWNGAPQQLFTMLGDSLSTQPLNITSANLLAISAGGELAVTLHGSHRAHMETVGGTLARTPLAGGSPRELLENVPFADWDASGEMAVVHTVGSHDRIEYPIGKIIYESKGWISHLRISPRSNAVAFIEHPNLWDDRGSAVVMGTDGHVNVVSREWESADGLAWSRDGKEVWFTAARQGLSRDLHAMNLAGSVREILDLPAGMTLQDISSDGRVLLTVEAERVGMATVTPDGKMLDLSWHDWSVAKDISRDGNSVLFEDSSEAAGTHYSLAIRNIDGAPPVQLGEGSAGSLSPDGKWAISIVPGTPGEVRLIPIGAGQARKLSIPGLEHIQNGNAHFLGDGKHITINGNEAGHAVRSYLVDLEGGKPVPILPEGITGGLISPDGHNIIRLDENGFASIITVGESGAGRSIPNLEAGFIPVRWTDDNTSVYGYWQGRLPAEVYRLDVKSGRTQRIQQLQPNSTTGVIYIAPVVVNRDGSRIAYSYYQVFSVLYLVSGLR